MKTKYLLLPFLLLFFTFSLEAQKQVEKKTNSIKASDSNKELKQSRKPKKDIQLQENNSQLNNSELNNPTQRTSETKLETRPTETKPQNQPSTQELIKPQNTQSQNSNQPTNNVPDISFLEQYIEEIIEERTNGNINWSQQYVEAVGQSVMDTERFKNPAQARAMATRGAVVVAQRNLLEMVQGVNVVGETTVEDMITTSDYIYTRVEGFVKGAEQIGPAREVNGMIEVRLRMPIYGSKGIAGAFESSDLEKAKSNNGYKSLAKTIQQPDQQNFEDLIDGSNPFVFNIMGKEIDPSMFPVVVDNEGNIQFDFSDLYETKTGRFPKFVQLSKDVMNDIGFQKGVDVINLVQNGKGEFTLSNDNKKGVFWQKLGNVARGIGRFLFSIIT